MKELTNIDCDSSRIRFDDSYLREIEERVFAEGWSLKKAGKTFVGIYCAFTPKELISAAGAVPVTLCAGSQEPIATAESRLPKNLCPLIKASYGHALEDSCPYFHVVDLVFADATCDGKKKMFELLSQMKPIYVLQLPQTYETPESMAYWLQELKRMKQTLEQKTGTVIDDDTLRNEIKIFNLMRQTVKKVFSLNQGETPLLYGKEIDAITSGGGFDCNPLKRIREMEAATELAKERGKQEWFREEVKNKPRILLTGCPTTNKKVLEIIESCGGMVVAMENCGGLKTVGETVDELIDPLQALATYYVRTACPCMTPNQKRQDIIADIIRDYRIEGVVDLTWHGCHTYNVEACLIKQCVNQRCNTPYIQIETDYTESDVGQIKVRIEAFLELLR